ncbi:MAG: hypothetical protein CMH64_03560 [Nanoarchaeota archaeon]|nr:hypothetical protein [Nanoarchaeota archaeon]|tara:strand:+ start:548 stop:1147 length:600 start_codon:yes stop_codon:yes gene_type:complete
MKILAFTDLHDNKKAIKKIIKDAKEENPDILICAGDLSNFGTNFKKLLLEFKKAKTRLLIIPGNHETGDQVKNACKKTKFAISIHKGIYQLGKYLFMGYGEEGFVKEDKEFEHLAKSFKKEIKKDSKVILVTHAPPYKTKLDYLETTKDHHGNNSIRKFINLTKPILSICGHLHENENKIDKIKETIILNPGKGKIIEI